MNYYESIAYISSLCTIMIILKNIFGIKLIEEKKNECLLLIIACIGMVAVAIVNRSIDMELITLIMQVISVEIAFDDKKHLLAEMTTVAYFVIWVMRIAARNAIMFALYEHMIFDTRLKSKLDCLTTLMLLLLCIIYISVEKYIMTKHIRFSFNLHREIKDVEITLCRSTCIFVIGLTTGYAMMLTSEGDVVIRMQIIMLSLSGIVGLVILTFGILLHFVKRQNENLQSCNKYNEKCIEDQTRQYELITRKNYELSKLRHDQRSHLIALRDMAIRGDFEALIQYTDELSAINKKTDYISTGNIVGDAIINEWAEQAADAGIIFNVVGVFPDSISIKSTDLNCILSNVVKNAYEAALKSSSEKFIEIAIKNNNGRIFIKVTNSSDTNLIRQGKYLKTSNNNGVHGYGTRIIVDTVKKYDGNVRWYRNNLGHVITEVDI